MRDDFLHAEHDGYSSRSERATLADGTGPVPATMGAPQLGAPTGEEAFHRGLDR